MTVNMLARLLLCRAAKFQQPGTTAVNRWGEAVLLVTQAKCNFHHKYSWKQ